MGAGAGPKTLILSDLGINDLRWYIFNIADMFIVLGVILFILSQFILSKKNVGN